MSEDKQGYAERSWVSQWVYDARQRFYLPNARLSGKVCATLQELQAHLKIYQAEHPTDGIGEPFTSFAEPARHRAGIDCAGYTIYSARLRREPATIPLVCHNQPMTVQAAAPKVDIAYQCGGCKQIRFSPPRFFKHESNGVWLPYEGLEYVCWMCEAPMHLRILRVNDPVIVGKPTGVDHAESAEDTAQ